MKRFEEINMYHKKNSKLSERIRVFVFEGEFVEFLPKCFSGKGAKRKGK